MDPFTLGFALGALTVSLIIFTVVALFVKVFHAAGFESKLTTRGDNWATRPPVVKDLDE